MVEEEVAGLAKVDDSPVIVCSQIDYSVFHLLSPSNRSSAFHSLDRNILLCDAWSLLRLHPYGILPLSRPHRESCYSSDSNSEHAALRRIVKDSVNRVEYVGQPHCRPRQHLLNWPLATQTLHASPHLGQTGILAIILLRFLTWIVSLPEASQRFKASGLHAHPHNNLYR